VQISYQNKVIFFIFTVFLLISSCLIYVLNKSLSTQNLADIERQLNFTSTLLDDQLLENKKLALNYANTSAGLENILLNDLNLSKQDRLKSLHQIRNEFDANRVVLINKSFSIALDTKLDNHDAQSFPHSDVFAPSQTEAFEMIVPVDNIIYQWIVFPTKDLEVNNWVAIGYDIDKFFTHHLDTISPLNISLGFAYETARKQWVLSSPDFQNINHTLKSEVLNRLNLLKSKSQATMSLRHSDQMVMMIPLIKSKETPDITAILLYSFAESFKPYRNILTDIIVLFTMAFILIALGLTLLNKLFSKKLDSIVHFIDKVDKGDYQLRLPQGDKGVIGQLSSLLNNMIYKIELREKELLHKTRFDTITELPNKAYFLESLEHLVQDQQTQNIMITLVNIDRFPQINHALGHRVADRLLHHVGARISSIFSDAKLVGKMSGNSFGVLFLDRTPADAEEIANQLLALFENPFSVYTVTIDLSCHIGFSFYPEDGDDADTLIQKSDVAVFEARHKADHYAIYNIHSDPHQFNKLSLMSELREGLQHDEFEVYYQPKIDLNTEHVSQVEALVRWNHPYKGFMPPNLFIPMAEETGHIKKLTFWILNKAFAQSAAWQSKNITLKISINLSVKDLLNKFLLGYVTSLIEQYNISPENIIFEITESAFMQDPDNALEAIKNLRTLGFHFSIDDFGTGYSSMSYLKILPVSELKIDMAFIREIATNNRDAQIVKSTIELGHGLGLNVVAEGVEDEASVKLLQSFGCNMGQGYYFSKPLPTKELEEWLMNSKWGISFIR